MPERAIDVVDLRETHPYLMTVGQALVEGLDGGEADEFEATSLRQWIETLALRRPLDQGLLIVEHLFGVLPLVHVYLGGASRRSELLRSVSLGRNFASLGLFTPNPDFQWSVAAVGGELDDQVVRLSGEVRIASAMSEGSVVLVRLGDEDHRLLWLEHCRAGVQRRNASTAGQASGAVPPWLGLQDVAVPIELVSRPLSLRPKDGYARHLEAYVGVWAFAASLYASRGIRALRRAVRTQGHGGTSFSSSQLLVLEITELEIEAELVARSLDRHLDLDPDDAGRASGLVLATAACRVLSAVAAKTTELRDRLGVEVEGPLDTNGRPASSTNAFLGGPLTVESELARSLGI